MIKWLRNIFKSKAKEKNYVKEIPLVLNNKLEKNISFKLTPELELDNTWSELKNNSHFISQLTGVGGALGAVSSSANNLYMATVSPDELMNYADGTLSSITKNGTKFGEHSGFVSANLTAFTPILAFQFASLLTGHYYFNGLSKQLSLLQLGIDKLLELHHNERGAKLKFISHKLNELASRNFYTVEDFVSLDNLKYDLSVIRYEYLFAAENDFNKRFGIEDREEVKEINLDNLGKLEKGIIKTKEGFNDFIKTWISNVRGINFFEKGLNKAGEFFDKVQNLAENSNKKAQQLSRSVVENDYFFYCTMALKAEQLYQLSKLLEFKLNVLDKNPSDERIEKIKELYTIISCFNDKDSIYNKALKMNTNYKENILNTLLVLKNNSQINKTEISKAENVLRNKFNEIDGLISAKEDVLEDINKIKHTLKSSFKVLIDNRGNKEKVFIKII